MHIILTTAFTFQYHISLYSEAHGVFTFLVPSQFHVLMRRLAFDSLQDIMMAILEFIDKLTLAILRSALMLFSHEQSRHRREISVQLAMTRMRQTGKVEFQASSIVSVPVFVIRYSFTATSLPDSLPYPDCFIPPNGDSAAEELPMRERVRYVFSRIV
jgi:hypothetical protein